MIRYVTVQKSYGYKKLHPVHPDRPDRKSKGVSRKRSLGEMKQTKTPVPESVHHKTKTIPVWVVNTRTKRRKRF